MQKLLAGFLILLFSQTIYAGNKESCKSVPGGKLCIPGTSQKLTDDKTRRLSSNYTIFVPNAASTTPIETPPSLACIYGLAPYVPGCPIDGTTAVPTGGSGYIGIIDRGYDSSIWADFNSYAAHYNLPTCTVPFPAPVQPPALGAPSSSCFQVFNLSAGVLPSTNDNGGEQHIDVEWAHAMAPNAKIILFLGDDTQSLESLAETASAWLVQYGGGGIISMSLAGPEFPGELQSDASYQTPGVIYISSAGDYGTPARYPSASPYVISAGGSMVIRDASGNFVREEAWNHGDGIGSGGPSLYEPRPSYQNSVQRIVGAMRGTPDIAFAAYSLSIYNTTPGSSCGGFCAANGTSISAPALAGIINSANHGSRSSAEELTYIYGSAAKNYARDWRDITVGRSRLYTTLRGYDFCTGLGTPLGYGGK